MPPPRRSACAGRDARESRRQPGGHALTAAARARPLDRLRKLCLALPEAEEVLFGGHITPTFRVRNKIFAMYTDDHHGDGRVALWCKTPPGAQSVLISSDPDRFFSPPYVGPKGWIGVRLDRPVDWPFVADLIADSYRMTAPKRLAASLGPPA